MELLHGRKALPAFSGGPTAARALSQISVTLVSLVRTDAKGRILARKVGLLYCGEERIRRFRLRVVRNMQQSADLHHRCAHGLLNDTEHTPVMHHAFLLNEFTMSNSWQTNQDRGRLRSIGNLTEGKADRGSNGCWMRVSY